MRRLATKYASASRVGSSRIARVNQRGSPTALTHAIEPANRTNYGLSGSVWTAHVDKGEAIARRLECGTAWVNQHMELRHEAPFGGMKWSGIGRENGRWGIDEYCELQVISSARA